MITIAEEELQSLDSRFRANLINCLTGFKSTVLIGTQNSKGETNLAIFSQVIHIGANPPYMGVLFRPETVGRHTLRNIRETGFFTINHINSQFVKEAHLSSAKWEQSEFEALHLTPEYHQNLLAPFVGESNIQVGLKYAKEYPIDINNTLLLAGSVELIRLKSDYILPDGFIDVQAADSITCNGLDAYYKTTPIARYSYAKPNENLKELPYSKTI